MCNCVFFSIVDVGHTKYEKLLGSFATKKCHIVIEKLALIPMHFEPYETMKHIQYTYMKL